MRQLEAVHRLLDQVLYWLSVYAFPLVVCLVSVVALVSWNSEFAFVPGVPVEFNAYTQTESILSPKAALERLSNPVHPVSTLNTHLSESPHWLSFELPPGRINRDAIEFPSRHTQELQCWDASSFREMGSVTHQATSGALYRVKAGYALDIGGNLLDRVSVLCRAVTSGPARISIRLWDKKELAKSEGDDLHRAGVLEGGLLILAAFMLLAAIVNRDLMYLLFVAWLIANLRLAALSAGWDTQWLSHNIPTDWVHPIRKLTIASYYILTYTLFVRLFREELQQIGYLALLRLAQWLGLPLILAAALQPYQTFLPVMWVAVTIGSLILVFLLLRILMLARSAVANWYAASIAITVVSGLTEVISAALGLRAALWIGNSVVAAGASSLLAALAIAAQVREEKQKRVRAQEELKGTYEALPLGLFSLDDTGAFIGYNPAAYRMLHGAPLSHRTAQIPRWQDLFGNHAWMDLRRVADEHLDLELAGPEGTPLADKTFLVKATIAGNRIEGSIQDVTDRVKATERLQYLAENDPLTRVLNRRGIENELLSAGKEISSTRPLVIAYLDLDRFKLINDLYGHTTGDEVLREICDRVRLVLGSIHRIGRVGGDEFVIVFKDIPLVAATRVCQRMIGAIEDSPCHIGEKSLQVRGSIGLVEIADPSSIREAVSVADRACREAKRHPIRLVVYERDAQAFTERAEELALIGRFGGNHVPDGLFLDMQPIMSLAAPYDSLNFEVLLRLREPDNSVTPAWKIISAAENNGRISMIDRWVLQTTLDWLSENKGRLPKTQFVCVNLSGGSLNDERFVRDAFAMVAAAPEVASLLCFEITESVALHDLGNTSRFIDTVRSYGAKVALDDFGAGYTSFSYLKELAAEAVKIDGAFVRDVNTHPANLAIVEAIAELSHNLGMKTIAEWAEDAATVAVLKEIGVDYVQGYAVARPMSPARILTADSCAALIEDTQVARLVWDGMGNLSLERHGDVPAGLILPPLPMRLRH